MAIAPRQTNAHASSNHLNFRTSGKRRRVVIALIGFFIDIESCTSPSTTTQCSHPANGTSRPSLRRSPREPRDAARENPILDRRPVDTLIFD
jgi:hypothetical protein